MPKLDALPLGAHRVLRALTDEGLFAQAGVRIAFTGREGGVSEGAYASLNCGSHVDDDLDAVMRNRQIVLDAIGVPDAPLVVPVQVHGTNIVCVGAGPNLGAGAAAREAQKLAEQGADGVVVPMSGVAALLNFADCLPLIIVAPSGAFAVAHAGWRGALARIASMAACSLAEITKDSPSQFNAYIGPHIRSECFEVSPEVADMFSAEFGADVLAADNHVSLAGAVSADLVSAGLRPDRIADACVCTMCHPDEYFSYRASGGVCGRHTAVAVR